MVGKIPFMARMLKSAPTFACTARSAVTVACSMNSLNVS